MAGAVRLGPLSVPAGLYPAFGVILAAGMGGMAAAWFIQYGLGIMPCSLCFTQRHYWFAAMGLAAVGLIAPARIGSVSVNAYRPALLLLALLALAGGAAVAGYHTGVEQKWWPGPASCTGGTGAMPGSIAELQALLESSARATACDEIAWSFLGLSMAAWNMALSLGALGVSVWAWRAGVLPQALSEERVSHEQR